MNTIIQAQYRLHDGDQRWRVSQTIYAGGEPGSTTAVVDGEEVPVIFGWTGGRAYLRVGDRVPVDLTDGPVELEGPRARWRWRVAK